MQKDFVTGALGTLEAVSIIGNVAARAKKYDEEDIIFTRDTHHNDYLETLEGRKLPIPHCIKDTDGWEIIPVLCEYILNHDENVFNKNTFGSDDLIKYLCNCCENNNCQDFEEIELCGVCTDICVISNALMIRSAYPNSKIIVRADCCAGTTPEAHEAALKVMESCQIDVIR